MRGGSGAPGDGPPLLRATGANSVRRDPLVFPTDLTAEGAASHRAVSSFGRRVRAQPAEQWTRRARKSTAVPREHPEGVAVPADAIATQRLLPIPPTLGRD